MSWPEFLDAPFEWEAPAHWSSLPLANKHKQAVRQAARSPGPLPLVSPVAEGLTLDVCERGVEFRFGVGNRRSGRRRR
jgi:hypothetical protein